MGTLLSKLYFRGHEKDVISYLPYLPVRLRENKMQMGGRSFSYEDATKFVHRDGAFVPLLCAGEVKEEERVFDLYMFLNIGLTEVLLTMEPNRTRFEHTLISILCSEKMFPTIEDALDYAMESKNFDEALGQSIRSSQIRYDFHVVKKIVTLFNIAHDANPKFYFEQLFDLMQIAYTYCLPWVRNDEHEIGIEYSIVSRGGEAPSMEEVAKFVNTSMHQDGEKYGAVEYATKDGKKRRITDGRGAGVFFFLLFMYHVYNMYADVNDKKREQGMLRDGTLGIINERLESCIGDDAVGKYLKAGKIPPNEIRNDAADAMGAVRYTVLDCKVTCKGDEDEVTTRGFMDSKVMFEHATGYSGGNYASFSYNDCFYNSYEETYACVIYTILCQEDYEMLKNGLEHYVYDTLEKHDEILLAYAEEHLPELWEKYKKTFSEKYEEENALMTKEERLEEEKKKEELADENEALKKKIVELEMQLENKRRQVEDAREELEVLRESKESFYSEDDFEEEVSPATLEEMVEFLKDFRITMVGGHFDTENRLSSMGLENIIYIRSEQEAQGSTWQTDFICICATFVSHKIVYSVESKFQDKRGETLYFNGTNANKLVRALYEFVQKWMEK